MKIYDIFKSKETLENERLELEKLKKEKDFKAKMIINKTKLDLQNTIDKLSKQKNEFLEIAKKSKLSQDKEGLRTSFIGWKISATSQKRASMMLNKLNLTEQMKEIGEISKSFSESMVIIAKQLTEVTKNTDFMSMEKNFTDAMNTIDESELYLSQFFENIDINLDSLSNVEISNSEGIDKEFLDLVDNSIFESEYKDLEKAQNKLNNGNSKDDFINKRIEEIKKKLGDV
jgi:hypothetical protein